MPNITTGLRLYSGTSTAEVVVVKAANVELHCGGEPMLTSRAGELSSNAPGAPITVGKRYTDAYTGLLLLCTKSGAGPLSADGRELQMLAAKPLPSSD